VRSRQFLPRVGHATPPTAMERKVDNTLCTVRVEIAKLEADGKAEIVRESSQPGTPARVRLATRSADGDRCCPFTAIPSPSLVEHNLIVVAQSGYEPDC